MTNRAMVSMLAAAGMFLLSAVSGRAQDSSLQAQAQAEGVVAATAKEVAQINIKSEQVVVQIAKQRAWLETNPAGWADNRVKDLMAQQTELSQYVTKLQGELDEEVAALLEIEPKADVDSLVEAVEQAAQPAAQDANAETRAQAEADVTRFAKAVAHEKIMVDQLAAMIARKKAAEGPDYPSDAGHGPTLELQHEELSQVLADEQKSLDAKVAALLKIEPKADVDSLVKAAAQAQDANAPGAKAAEADVVELAKALARAKIQADQVAAKIADLKAKPGSDNPFYWGHGDALEMQQDELSLTMATEQKMLDEKVAALLKIEPKADAAGLVKAAEQEVRQAAQTKEGEKIAPPGAVPQGGNK